MELEDEAQVLVAESSDVLVFLVGDIDAIDVNGTCVGSIEGAHDLQERGLARSRWADDTHDLSLVDVEVDTFKHLQGAEGFGDVVESYHFSLLHFTFYISFTPFLLSTCSATYRCGWCQ